MNKSLFAIYATLISAGAANAENSITLYGTIDGGMQSLSRDRFGERQTTFQDSPATSNRFGLRGAIDLGPTWQATVNLEGRYFLDGRGPPAQYGSGSNVVNRLFDRGANLGLEGPYGSFRLGLITNPVTAAHVAGDVRPAANSGGGIFAWYRNRSIDSTCVDGSCDFTFLQRALSYRSPTFGGVTGSAFYVFSSGNRDAATTSNRNNGGFGGALNYTAGPFSANAAAQQMYDQAGARIGRVAVLNGAYAYGPLLFKAGTTLFRQYAGGVLYRLNSAVNTAPFGTVPSVDQTNRLDHYGAAYRVNEDLSLTLAGYNYRRADDPTNRIDMYTFGADYAVNKRVTAYAIVTTARNGSAANQSAGYYSLTTVPGASNNALTIGIRAVFDANFKF